MRNPSPPPSKNKARADQGASSLDILWDKGKIARRKLEKSCSKLGQGREAQIFYAYFSLFFFIACFFFIFARDLVIFFFLAWRAFGALIPYPALFSKRSVFHGVEKYCSLLLKGYIT